MQIGLISDIHGNLPALDAVLSDMPPVETLICAGDIVGYNPWPAECLERVRDTADVIVQGNHDRNVETPEQYRHNEMAHAGLEYAQSELTTEQRQWLAELSPWNSFADDTYKLVHSHPEPEKLGTYVRPRQFPKMRPYLDEHDGIVIGHTHIQHEATIDGRLIINPGSVGQPRDGDSNAAYAILDTESHSVDLRRVDYDIDCVVTKTEDVGLPVRTATRLLEGK